VVGADDLVAHRAPVAPAADLPHRALDRMHAESPQRSRSDLYCNVLLAAWSVTGPYHLGRVGVAAWW
jgi:hypothetical protein